MRSRVVDDEIPGTGFAAASWTRRSFLISTAALGLAAAWPWASSGRRQKLGFLGLGDRGLAALSVCLGRGMPQTFALCDRDPAALARADSMARNSAAFRMGEVGELLATPALGAIVVALPSAQQIEIALQACSAGKDVFLMRPLPEDAGALRELEGVAQSLGRRVQIGRETVANLSPESARRLEGGLVVDRVHVYAEITSPRPLDRSALVAQLVDELDFGLSVLGGEVRRRLALGGAGCRPESLFDARIHFELERLGGPGALDVSFTARRGARSEKRSRILVASAGGTVETGTRPNEKGAPEDLAVFLDGREGEERAMSPGLLASRLELLLGGRVA